MTFKERTVREIAEMICGDSDASGKGYFPYRSGSKLTRFFMDCDTDYVHDGTTRTFWVSDVIQEILSLPTTEAYTLPEQFQEVIKNLMDKGDSTWKDPERADALSILNKSLSREGYEAFYAEDGCCYLKHVKTQRTSTISNNPQRPLSKIEVEMKAELISFLNNCSEDELIEEILLPMFRRLGFLRITAVGHKDKSLEYGKDMWMKFTLPTLHGIYFGIQVKKGKLDAAGMTKNTNVSEILDQTRMMLGHEIFDPETNKKALVDHALIVCGGEITKSARNWLGGQLNTSQRSQILFLDRDDILDLCVVNKIEPPKHSKSTAGKINPEEIPF